MTTQHAIKKMENSLCNNECSKFENEKENETKGGVTRYYS